MHGSGPEGVSVDRAQSAASPWVLPGAGALSGLWEESQPCVAKQDLPRRTGQHIPRVPPGQSTERPRHNTACEASVLCPGCDKNLCVTRMLIGGRGLAAWSASVCSFEADFTCAPSSQWKPKNLPKLQGGSNEACCQPLMCRAHTCQGPST